MEEDKDKKKKKKKRFIDEDDIFEIDEDSDHVIHEKYVKEENMLK